MEYRIWNPESDTLTIPRLSECEKLTNNVEVGNNEHNEQRKAVYDECVRVMKLGPEKRVCDRIFVIVIYEYYNNRFL